MRGDDKQQAAMFSYVTMEQRIAADHPMRRTRELVDGALEKLDALFDEFYSKTGHPSIAPERLLRAQWHPVPFKRFNPPFFSWTGQGL